MEVIELLEKTYELLSDPKRWIKGDFARDKTGHTVGFHAPEATCWCLVGAIYKIAGNDRNIQGSALTILEANCPYFSLITLNDKSTHEEVMEFLKATIDKEKANVSSNQDHH